MQIDDKLLLISNTHTYSGMERIIDLTKVYILKYNL